MEVGGLDHVHVVVAGQDSRVGNDNVKMLQASRFGRLDVTTWSWRDPDGRREANDHVAQEAGVVGPRRAQPTSIAEAAEPASYFTACTPLIASIVLGSRTSAYTRVTFSDIGLRQPEANAEPRQPGDTSAVVGLDVPSVGTSDDYVGHFGRLLVLERC